MIWCRSPSCDVFWPSVCCAVSFAPGGGRPLQVIWTGQMGAALMASQAVVGGPAKTRSSVGRPLVMTHRAIASRCSGPPFLSCTDASVAVLLSVSVRRCSRYDQYARRDSVRGHHPLAYNACPSRHQVAVPEAHAVLVLPFWLGAVGKLTKNASQHRNSKGTAERKTPCTKDNPSRVNNNTMKERVVTRCKESS